MKPFQFRPSLDNMEDRTVPSVTPQQVVNAYTFTMTTADELKDLVSSLKDGRTTTEINYIGTHFRQATDASRAATAVLADYLNELQTQMAANPALVNSIGQFAGGIGFAEYQSVINTAYADVLATQFGVPPPVPPPPLAEDSSPDFGTTTSNLPFSLSDPSFQTQASGVRTWDTVVGSGTAVQVGDQITANYTGYLPDGTIFDSSDKSGQLSTTLDTGHLIQGFVNGVVGMQPGGTRRIDIPASQGYGANPPSGSGIPANSELIFEVTLVSSP